MRNSNLNGGLFRHRFVQGAAALAMSATLISSWAGVASAKGHESHAAEARPGWGCGDTNHVHSGPPGRHGDDDGSPCSSTKTNKGENDDQQGNDDDQGQQGDHDDRRQNAPSLTISVPSTTTAGAAFNFTVTALTGGAGSATNTSFADKLHFSSSDTSAVLPADSTLTNGTGTFSATLKAAGNETITVTDTAVAGFGVTSGKIAVAAAAATHFTVYSQTMATAGTSFDVIVRAQDQFNNIAGGYTGTVHFTSSDGAAVLPADTTLTNGAGQFAVTLNTAGSQTITAIDTATASVTGTTSNITVS